MPLALPQPPFAPHSAPGILLVEHELNGARFVHSLIFDVLKADVWLWHEETLDPALRLLGAVQFKLILLDLNLPKVTARKAVRSVRKVAPRTPLVLLMRPEEFSPGIEPRVYQAEAVVPRGVGEPLMGIIRRLLQRG